MTRWTVVTLAMVSAVLSLHSTEKQASKEAVEPDKKEVVEMGKQQQPKEATDGGVKRRWTKRAKPGSPKARKAAPSRKKVATLDNNQIVFMDEEEQETESEQESN